MHIEQHILKRSHVPQFSLRALLLAVLCASLALALVAFVRQRAAHRRVESDRLAKLDQTTLREIIEDVEAIRAQLGRVPKDEDELESHLGRSMPFVHDEGHPTPIHYYPKDENSFYLVYTTWATDDWYYDSDKPNSGWVQRYF